MRPAGGAMREVGISGWSRGEEMRIAAAKKMPRELSVEPQLPFQ